MRFDGLQNLDRQWVKLWHVSEFVDGYGTFCIGEDHEWWIACIGEDEQIQTIEPLMSEPEVEWVHEPVEVQIYKKADSFFRGYFFIDHSDNTHLCVGNQLDLDDENHQMIFQKEFKYF